MIQGSHTICGDWKWGARYTENIWGNPQNACCSLLYWVYVTEPNVDPGPPCPSPPLKFLFGFVFVNFDCITYQVHILSLKSKTSSVVHPKNSISPPPQFWISGSAAKSHMHVFRVINIRIILPFDWYIKYRFCVWEHCFIQYRENINIHYTTE